MNGEHPKHMITIISLILDGISEKLSDGQALMTHMEGSGKLSEGNFTELTGLLGDIYRKDLIKRIEKFNTGEL